MGLGILGGGVATARFLVEKGAELTVTDMKSKEYLKPSLEKLKDFSNIKYVLGEHREEDFLNNEIIVINPDVSLKNKYVELAKQNGKQIENELTFFCRFCPSKKIVAVTGTRGKTTTVNWVVHLLKQQFPNTILVGNSPENTFLGMLGECNKDSFVVLEVPSYHLELENDIFSPHVAVITNIYQDHLNRHSTMEEYAKTKSNIFRNQKEDDFLILNKDNEWTNFLLDLKPKSQVLLFSPNENSPNLAASVLVAQTMGIDDQKIEKAIPTLPQIKWRQEKVFENEKMAIYNDTAATSPEATITALNRFGNEKHKIFICGGTDRELDFQNFGEIIRQKLQPEELILLSGSATEKMKAQIGSANYKEFDTLKECLEKALQNAEKQNGKTYIVFSPGAKSFEKFKNEFDRGEQFNLLIKNLHS